MAEEKKKSYVLEAVIIAALLLLLWKATRKKVVVRPAGPVKMVDKRLISPDFNLNDYCQNIVYKPLDLNDIVEAPLLGKGWCARGDRSIVDQGAGFGDAYADQQAIDYIHQKQDQAILANNKNVVQFRLINTGTTKITTKLLNIEEDPTIFNGGADVPVLPPVLLPVSNIFIDGFTADWSASADATGYKLDVAYDSAFASMVAGFNDLDVGNVNSITTSGLTTDTVYHYRVRAYNAYGTSDNSNLESVYVTDSIVIGLQRWVTKNVRVNISASRVYNDDEANRTPLGGLYRYDQVDEIEALHPGWEVPGIDQATELQSYLGGETVAGAKLKEDGEVYWAPGNTGTNITLFTARAGGAYSTIDGYISILESGLYMIKPFVTGAVINYLWMNMMYFDDYLSFSGGGGDPPYPVPDIWVSVRLIRKGSLVSSTYTSDNSSLTVDSDILRVDQA